MRTLDFHPFYRASIGFDRMFASLDRASSEASTQSYPPYNIERVSDDEYRILVAVAGFADAEIDIEVRNRSLLICGNKADKTDSHEYLHRGIATRNFERRFELADHVVVKGAQLENGLLKLDLVREIPEALKRRKIKIRKGVGRVRGIEGESEKAA
jgi:molecular chaperone IbpA